MTSKHDFMALERTYNNSKERRRLRGLWWAVVLIWAGLVLGADRMGLVPQIADASAWSWIFVGAGTVGMLGAIYRLASPDVLNPTIWDWVWALICLTIGLDGFVALEIFWPLSLVVVGGAILVNGLWWRG